MCTGLLISVAEQVTQLAGTLLSFVTELCFPYARVINLYFGDRNLFTQLNYTGHAFLKRAEVKPKLGFV